MVEDVWEMGKREPVLIENQTEVRAWLPSEPDRCVRRLLHISRAAFEAIKSSSDASTDGVGLEEPHSEFPDQQE